MAKGKTRNSKTSRKNSQNKSLLTRLFSILTTPVIWRTLFVVLVVVVLWWQLGNLVAWVTSVASSIANTFGWGLLLIILAVIALAAVAWRQKYSRLINKWNWCLGGLVFALVIWGLLAFWGQGGTIGLSIIGNPAPDVLGRLNGSLRLLALVIAGVLLVAPRATIRVITGLVSWLGQLIEKQTAPRPAESQKKIFTAKPETTENAEVEAEAPPATPDTVPAQAQLKPASEQPKRDLKQVAQDVWKKYGESTSLVTVDGWSLPPIDILEVSPEMQFSQADNVERARLIEEALGSYGVEAKVVQINAGPTVTQFGIEPGWDRKTREIKERDKDGNITTRVEEISKTRVKVERINSLSNDLALALAAPSIRIEAPVPGKSIVGIEVPNTISSAVSLRGVIETSVFQKVQSRSKLGLALGKGAGGEAVAGNLAKMPHLLIAGATGSGKTVCLNSIICCLLMYNTSYDLKFIMIDPKRVELTNYDSIPHLQAPVIVDTQKALEALRWLQQEMDRRYKKLATGRTRNIDSYNKDKEGDEKMPYLVLVIDELADLMMAGGDEVEQILCRLAQLSRAVGIHLVVATQRPSVDVVTGLIKANFPTRISFAVTSQVDSRTILDIGGAEKLLGSGDMLYMPTEAGKPRRLQGCYVSDAEIERLVYFWGNQRRDEEVSLKLEELIPSGIPRQKPDIPEDLMMEDARKLADEHENISTSFLQRRLRIGYPRAARIMEQLIEEKEKGEEVE